MLSERMMVLIFHYIDLFKDGQRKIAGEVGKLSQRSENRDVSSPKTD
jgi:hypothetical protein